MPIEYDFFNDRIVPPLLPFPRLKLDTPRLKALWRIWVDDFATLQDLTDPNLGEKNFMKYAGLGEDYLEMQRNSNNYQTETAFLGE